MALVVSAFDNLGRCARRGLIEFDDRTGTTLIVLSKKGNGLAAQGVRSTDKP